MEAQRQNGSAHAHSDLRRCRADAARTPPRERKHTMPLLINRSALVVGNAFVIEEGMRMDDQRQHRHCQR